MRTRPPRTDELSEGAHAANKGVAAHDIKESGAVRLTRNTDTGTLMTNAVGKLPTDGTKKDKLDRGIDSRSMRVVEDKNEGTAKVHCLVDKALSMSPDLDDCSVSHRGLDRLMCAWHVGQGSRARGTADANRRQRHQASLSARARALRAH